MNRTATRLATLAATGAVVAAMTVAGATAANAAAPSYRNSPIVGSLVGTMNPTATNVPVYARTSAPCPAGTVAIEGAMYSTAAPGWSEIPAIADQGFDAINTSGVVLNNNLLGIAAANGLTLADGHYDIAVACFIDPFGDGAAQFNGGFTVAGTTVTWDTPAMPASTTTVSVNPGTADTSTPVTLQASVSSTGTPISGTVNFTENGTTIASAAVSGGTASATHTFTTAGTHTVNATYVPDGAAGAAGSSSTTGATVTITAAPVSTTTVLTTSAVNPTDADVIPLTAAVTPNTATGAVTFTEVGGTYTQTATVSGGSASVSLTGVSAGTHTYRAAFAGTGTFTNSTSGDLVVTVTHFAGATASENITTSIPAGTLTISAASGTVDLGQLQLSPDATRFQTAAPVNLNTITVSDTRAGSKGWNVNGVVSDFVGGTGSDQINSGNLGWTPQVLTTGTGQTVNAATAVTVPAAPIAVGTATTEGLRTAKPLASSPAGASVGTATMTAALSMIAPTTTQPGVYNAVLTLTAI